ncbi:Glyoxylate/hydroxypyruvate reductase A [Cedecea neteri]|uniref:Glyoxylate/hydroxypyruvate reductase A n=1 Tax=Cedecea neteri TaxID=158822 RepID=A0A2X3JG90_9ENTR|nr:Glyoxylate/hydroxypyruvate reductase A [Cedecea neteri]
MLLFIALGLAWHPNSRKPKKKKEAVWTLFFHHPTFDTEYWLNRLQQALPGARVRQWKQGDQQPADYALVWHPPVEMLSGRKGLKGVFALGAGVDAILSKLQAHPDMLPDGVPLFRLEDTGDGAADAGICGQPGAALVPTFDDYQRPKNSRGNGSHWTIIVVRISLSGSLALACWVGKWRKVLWPGLPGSLLEPQQERFPWRREFCRC